MCERLVSVQRNSVTADFSFSSTERNEILDKRTVKRCYTAFSVKQLPTFRVSQLESVGSQTPVDTAWYLARLEPWSLPHRKYCVWLRTVTAVEAVTVLQALCYRSHADINPWLLGKCLKTSKPYKLSFFTSQMPQNRQCIYTEWAVAWTLSTQVLHARQENLQG
jgi:hypothetical protein